MRSICDTRNIKPVLNFIQSVLQQFSIYSSNDFSYLSFKVIDIRKWNCLHSVLNILPKENVKWCNVGGSWWPCYRPWSTTTVIVRQYIEYSKRESSSYKREQLERICFNGTTKQILHFFFYYMHL